MEEVHFRFQDLRVWQGAVDLCVQFHEVAEGLESRKLFRYAEQLRAAGLSPSNNIAEGSGSEHVAEQRQFLNIARRSLFETASMLFVFHRLALIDQETRDILLRNCDALSRGLVQLSRALRGSKR